MGLTNTVMVKNGVVENIAVYDPDTEEGQAWKQAIQQDGYTLVDVPTHPTVGWTFDGTNLNPPPEPVNTDG